MSEVERTSAGLQIVIPGCERRTLPKSTTALTKSVRAYFSSTNRRACARGLRIARMLLCGRAEDKRHCRKVVCSAPRLLPRALAISKQCPCLAATCVMLTAIVFLILAEKNERRACTMTDEPAVGC
jgi:hypothetical protein